MANASSVDILALDEARRLVYVLQSGERPVRLLESLDALLTWMIRPDGESSQSLDRAIAEAGLSREQALHYAYERLEALLLVPDVRSPRQLLGLLGEVDPVAIKRRYRQLVSIYHPDRDPIRSADHNLRMERINRAYRQLQKRFPTSGDKQDWGPTLAGYESQEARPASSKDVEPLQTANGSQRAGLRLRPWLKRGDASRLQRHLILGMTTGTLLLSGVLILESDPADQVSPKVAMEPTELPMGLSLASNSSLSHSLMTVSEPAAVPLLPLKSESEAVPEPEPITEPEPIAAPEPEPITEPEPIAAPEPEPITEPEPIAAPEPEPITEPEPIAAPEPEPITEPEPIAAPEPEPITEPEPIAAPEPEPITEPEPIAAPEPEPITDPAPIPEGKPMPAPPEQSLETQTETIADLIPTRAEPASPRVPLIPNVCRGASAVLRAFSQAYQDGEADRLARLFATDGRDQQTQGRDAIRTLYADWLAGSRDRNLQFSTISGQPNREIGCTLEAAYELDYRDTAGTKYSQNGRLAIELKLIQGRLQIQALDY